MKLVMIILASTSLSDWTISLNLWWPILITCESRRVLTVKGWGMLNTTPISPAILPGPNLANTFTIYINQTLHSLHQSLKFISMCFIFTEISLEFYLFTHTLGCNYILWFQIFFNQLKSNVYWVYVDDKDIIPLLQIQLCRNPLESHSAILSPFSAENILLVFGKPTTTKKS